MSSIKIRVVVVDDEPEITDLMRSLLASFPDVSLIATATNAKEAFDAITQLQPDIAFLDIRMPGKSGLELAAALKAAKSSTKLVFATAYDEHAIQAIKLAAFDFLLKPVDPEELREVFRRFRSDHELTDLDNKLNSFLKHINHEIKLRLNTRTGYIVIEPTEIVHIRAGGNYSEIIFSLIKMEVVTQHIGYLAEMLPQGKFFRASRSSLINLAYLSKVDRKCRKCTLEKNNESFYVTIARERMGELEKVTCA